MPCRVQTPLGNKEDQPFTHSSLKKVAKSKKINLQGFSLIPGAESLHMIASGGYYQSSDLQWKELYALIDWTLSSRSYNYTEEVLVESLQEGLPYLKEAANTIHTKESRTVVDLLMKSGWFTSCRTPAPDDLLLFLLKVVCYCLDDQALVRESFEYLQHTLNPILVSPVS